MIWFNNLLFWVPLVLSSIIILWLFYLTLKAKNILKAARRGLLAVIIIYFLQIAMTITYFYFRLKGDEFGKFLLPPKSNYFYQFVWEVSASHVLALAIGVVLVLVLLLLRKIFNSEIVDRADLYILLLTVFVVGASSVLVLVIASFFLMIFFLIGYNLKRKKVDTRAKLVLTPFLLITAFAILILSNLPTDRAGFDFYQKFLTLLRLN